MPDHATTSEDTAGSAAIRRPLPLFGFVLTSVLVIGWTSTSLFGSGEAIRPVSTIAWALVEYASAAGVAIGAAAGLVLTGRRLLAATVVTPLVSVAGAAVAMFIFATAEGLGWEPSPNIAMHAIVVVCAVAAGLVGHVALRRGVPRVVVLAAVTILTLCLYAFLEPALITTISGLLAPGAVSGSSVSAGISTGQAVLLALEAALIGTALALFVRPDEEYAAMNPILDSIEVPR